jgi:hypothetical protein
MVSPEPDINLSARDLRDAARNALVVASRAQRENIARGERILGYYLARSLSYGLTLSEIAEITELDCTEILRLTDPAVCG